MHLRNKRRKGVLNDDDDGGFCASESWYQPSRSETNFSNPAYCSLFLYLRALLPQALHFSLNLDLFHLRQSIFQGLDCPVNISTVLIHHAHAHMPKSDVLCCDLLVQTTGKDDALLHQTWHYVRRCQT